MQTATQASASPFSALTQWLKANTTVLIVLAGAIALPFVVALLDGQSFSSLLANEAGQSKFVQGLMIEVFILAIFAISYDLVFGVTGLLSFGHAMFFALGAYLSGVLLKTFGWGLLPALGMVALAAIVNALLFSVVLPRVKGITFALVTLGIATVFWTAIQSRELKDFTGGDVGLQGVVPPAFINTNTERLRFYFITLVITLLVYLLYRRFVDSPTGKVCLAISQNENRALMLGYNTFWFKLIVLIIASITAALAGMLHMIHSPLVSPNVAGLGYTILALLIILIGGVGTLSGALVGALIYRLMTFLLEKWFGQYSNFLIGAVYVALVLFLPYGIVGTWKMRSFRIKEGRERLARLFSGRKE